MRFLQAFFTHCFSAAVWRTHNTITILSTQTVTDNTHHKRHYLWNEIRFYAWSRDLAHLRWFSVAFTAAAPQNSHSVRQCGKGEEDSAVIFTENFGRKNSWLGDFRNLWTFERGLSSNPYTHIETAFVACCNIQWRKKDLWALILHVKTKTSEN